MNKLVREIKLSNILSIELSKELKEINAILDNNFINCLVKEEKHSIYYVNGSGELFLEYDKNGDIFYIPKSSIEVFKKYNSLGEHNKHREQNIEELFRYKIIDNLNYYNVREILVDHFNIGNTFYGKLL